MNLQPFGMFILCGCSRRLFVTGHRTDSPEPGLLTFCCPQCGARIERQTAGQVDPSSIGVRASE